MGKLTLRASKRKRQHLESEPWGGGVTFARKAAALAEAFAEPIAFDDCSRTVTLTLSTHLAMARPNVTGEITRASYYGATTSAWTGCPRWNRAASVLQKARCAASRPPSAPLFGDPYQRVVNR